MRNYTFIALMALILAIYPVQPGAAALYSVQGLGITPNHSVSIGEDINNNGSVLCLSASANDESGFIWSDGDIKDLYGQNIYVGAGINKNDQTAGMLDAYDEYGHLTKSTPYIRNADGSITNLTSITGFTHVWLDSIDDAGQVIVSLQNDGSYTGGYAVVDKNGLTPITTPDSTVSVNAISNSGSVIVNNKYIWTFSGGATALPWLVNAAGVDITCMNDLGWVAGVMNGHSVRWDNEGNFADLGVGNASAINNLGQVVGDINDQAVMWDTDGSIAYLPLLEGYLHAGATAINDKGQIAGTAWYNGYTTDMAVLWQPVPEPSSIVALLCGISGMGGILLRRRTK